jgi:hypothetical protein
VGVGSDGSRNSDPESVSYHETELELDSESESEPEPCQCCQLNSLHTELLITKEQCKYKLLAQKYNEVRKKNKTLAGRLTRANKAIQDESEIATTFLATAAIAVVGWIITGLYRWRA